MQNTTERLKSQQGFWSEELLYAPDFKCFINAISCQSKTGMKHILCYLPEMNSFILTSNSLNHLFKFISFTDNNLVEYNTTAFLLHFCKF